MPDGDCFRLLGISSDSTAEQVRRAWRQQARRHHPDVGGDTTSMARLNAALAEALRLVAHQSTKVASRPAGAPSGAGTAPGRPSSAASASAPRRVWRDVPSFTIDCLPVDSFEMLTIVAATLGSVIEEEIPYWIEFSLESSEALPGAANWCRCEIFPEAGASSVHLSVGAAAAVGDAAVVALRDEIVRVLNELDS